MPPDKNIPGVSLKRIFWGVCLLLLSACTSIPLSSMLKMASMDGEDISAIDPKQVRVRLSITEPVELQTKNVKLVLQFDHHDGEQSEFQYLLEIIDDSVIDPVSSWFSQAPMKHAYEFKLAALSQLEFNKYQKNFARHGKPERYQWTVYYYMKNRPRQGEGITIDMELKFSLSEDYFYLLKNAKVDVN